MFDIAEATGRWVLWGLMTAINGLVAGVGAVLGTLLALLPSMPDPPAAPVAAWVGWLNWAMPVAEFFTAAQAFIGLWVTFLLIKIALNWVKGL